MLGEKINHTNHFINSERAACPRELFLLKLNTQTQQMTNTLIKNTECKDIFDFLGLQGDWWVLSGTVTVGLNHQHQEVAVWYLLHHKHPTTTPTWSHYYKCAHRHKRWKTFYLFIYFLDFTQIIREYCLLKTWSSGFFKVLATSSLHPQCCGAINE